jgi:hypothetical protein
VRADNSRAKSDDPEFDVLYDKCRTTDELRAEIEKIVAADGHRGEKWVNLTIRALFGGTTAYLQEDGQYTNKWRRKFQGRIGLEKEE